MAFLNLEEAVHFNAVIMWFKNNRSIEEKDKLVEELIIRKCEAARDDVVYGGIMKLKSIIEAEKK